MQPHERTEHRHAIAGVVEVVLHGYWRDDMPDAMRAAILRDWCDELEGWPARSVRAALRKHREEQPNKKPNPGHILAILKDSWGRRNAETVAAAIAQPMEAPKPRMSEEARRAILAEAGLKDPLAVRTIDGITPATEQEQLQ